MPERNDRIGRRVNSENPIITIKRSFWSQFSSLFGFWIWAIMLINDFLKIVDVSKISEALKGVLGEDFNLYIVCGAVAVLLLVICLVIAYLRSRMVTYIYSDTMIYIPGRNPRKNTRARSFVGVYEASVLPATGFFLFAWVKGIRRFIRGYRDIVISCPGSQSDGTIILRGVANYKKVITALNANRVSESTNVAYNRPTASSTK